MCGNERLARTAPLGFLVAVLLSGCDPAAVTKLRVTTVQRAVQGDHTDLHVTTPDRESVLKLVAHVAESNGLKPSCDAGPASLAMYFRRYQPEKGRSVGLRLWVMAQHDHPNNLEIVVSEFVALRHGPLGKKILKELRTELASRGWLRTN